MWTGWRTGVSWAGLAVGPTAWAVSTQTNYGMSPWLCGSRLLAVLTAGVLIVFALAGAALSWRAWRSPRPANGRVSQENGEPHNFLAGLSMLIALLFAAVILMQGAAALVLTGCEA